MSPQNIRKQVYELTADDLESSTVWEFCLDEEGVSGQDEATVKPLVEQTQLDDLSGSQIAKTAFTFSDGKTATGYLYASADHNLPSIQPVIITPNGQVRFWYGIIAPKETTRADTITKLVTISEKPFPIQFSCLVRSSGIPIRGCLEGFYYYDRTRTIQLIKK